MANEFLFEEFVDLRMTSKVSLYAALSRMAENPVLLETCVPDGNSLLVWDPVAVISVKNGSVKLSAKDDVALPPASLRVDNVTDYLQSIIDYFRIREVGNSSGEFRFLGGLVGFVGYEWMVQQEVPTRPTEKGIPDMWFGLYDRAVVWDRKNLAKLVAVPKINNISPDTVRNQVKTAISAAASFSRRHEAFKTANLIYDFPREKYEKGVKEVKRAIRSGDVYQVDIAQRIRTAGLEPALLYERLKEINPSPFSGLLSSDDLTIVSASPERLLRVWTDPDGRRMISTRPIAGTRPRASGIQDSYLERSLMKSPKEIAEHTMLVDLSRNDIGRVAVPGSVEVSELYTVERYSHVMHLVSEVSGMVSESKGVPELFQALFPGGSITGTPKIRATEIIAEIEPAPRGAYTGSMGYISLDGSMDFNILIRSFFFPENRQEMHLYAGAGIVQDSNPEREWEETRAKAAALIEAVSGLRHSGIPWSPPHITSSWRGKAVSQQFSGSRVLLIDNYDSFTYNLVQYLNTLGAEVIVFRNDRTSISELKKADPTHVVISPGPGIPRDAGVTLEAVLEFSDYPLLGVCLGHQAIVEAYGGTLKRARLPMHGKTSRITCNEETRRNDILQGIPDSFLVGRYHSLVADDVPPELIVTAQTNKNEVMAIRHRDLPTFGVQFHPESILTPDGVKILSNFLSMKRTR